MFSSPMSPECLVINPSDSSPAQVALAEEGCKLHIIYNSNSACDLTRSSLFLLVVDAPLVGQATCCKIKAVDTQS